MTLNNRKISYLTYTADRNWVTELPKSNWLCILVSHDQLPERIDDVIAEIIDHDVCYICTVGSNCEWSHDFIDEQIFFRKAEDHQLPAHHIITTWHPNFDEGVWFALFAANNEDVTIEKVVILDMTGGHEYKRVMNILERLNSDE